MFINTRSFIIIDSSIKVKKKANISITCSTQILNTAPGKTHET